MSRSEPHSLDKRRRDEGNVSDTLLKRSKKGKKKAKASAQGDVLVNPNDYVKVVKVRNQPEPEENTATAVTLSKIHKSAQLQLSEDQLSVTGHKGFRSVRATHGVYEGAWYCEVTVTRLGKTGHCRLGWCAKKAELQGPIGFDKFGYSYRDLEGSKYHKAMREPYGEAYTEGDVIGMYLYMPESDRAVHQQEKKYVHWKGSWYYVDEPEPEPEPLPESVVAFTKNGVSQGPAFVDILHGIYHPAASLYTLPGQTEGATVTFNFGPDFKYSFAATEQCPTPRPFCEVMELKKDTVAGGAAPAEAKDTPAA